LLFHEMKDLALKHILLLKYTRGRLIWMSGLLSYNIGTNGLMQVFIADFGERQRPAERDGHARIHG